MKGKKEQDDVEDGACDRLSKWVKKVNIVGAVY